MKIRFTKDYQVDALEGDLHKEGSVLDCAEATATHFKNKGVAVDFVAAEAKPAETSQPETKKSESKKSKRR